MAAQRQRAEARTRELLTRPPTGKNIAELIPPADVGARVQLRRAADDALRALDAGSPARLASTLQRVKALAG